MRKMWPLLLPALAGAAATGRAALGFSAFADFAGLAAALDVGFGGMARTMPQARGPIQALLIHRR